MLLQGMVGGWAVIEASHTVSSGLNVTCHMLTKLLVAPACLHFTSNWPRTFFTPKVFLFSISLLFVNKYHYFVEAYKQMLL